MGGDREPVPLRPGIADAPPAPSCHLATRKNAPGLRPALEQNTLFCLIRGSLRSRDLIKIGCFVHFSDCGRGDSLLGLALSGLGPWVGAVAPPGCVPVGWALALPLRWVSRRLSRDVALGGWCRRRPPGGSRRRPPARGAKRPSGGDVLRAENMCSPEPPATHQPSARTPPEECAGAVGMRAAPLSHIETMTFPLSPPPQQDNTSVNSKWTYATA